MEPEVRKALIIASIFVITIMLIKHIYNSPVSYDTTTSKTVVVRQPVHRNHYNHYYNN